MSDFGAEPKRPPVERLSLDGGHPALDLANTVDPRHAGDPRHDYLEDYEDLIAWSLHAGILAPEVAKPLLRRREDRAARAVVSRARELREAAYEALAPGRQAPSERLELIGRLWAEAAAHRRLRPEGPAFRWAWEEAAVPDRALWPLAIAVGDLLTSPQLARVKECDAAGCGWLYLDRSKAGRRRWCSMASCGNREKARRYRESRDSRAA